jgi:hypothetical protein
MFIIKKNGLSKKVVKLKVIDNIMFFNKVFLHFHPTYNSFRV